MAPVSRRSGLFMIAAVAGASLSTVCASDPGKDEVLPASLQKQWAMDSLEYERRLSGWMRDSATIDSLARRADTRGLRVLYSQYRVVARAHEHVQRVVCEQANLRRKYGFRVAQRAIGMAEEAVWRTPRERRAAERELEKRLPRAFVVETSVHACGTLAPAGPDTVAGVNVNREPMRPVAPMRPQHPRR